MFPPSSSLRALSLWVIPPFMFYSRTGTSYKSTIRFLISYRRCFSHETMSSDGNVEGSTEWRPGKKWCCRVIEQTDECVSWQLHWLKYPRVNLAPFEVERIHCCMRIISLLFWKVHLGHMMNIAMSIWFRFKRIV